MLRKMSTEKNSDNTARVAITGYLVETQVVQTSSNPDSFDVRMVDKNTGADDLIISTNDFGGAVYIAEQALRERAIDEQIDGIDTLDTVSD